MIANNPDNTVAVVQRLTKHYRICVSGETISNDLMSHPAYPSLKSISDTLTRWKVENYAVQIDRNELLELSDPFIAHIKEMQEEKLLVVYRVSETSVVYAETVGRRRSMKLEEFLAKWDGIVLMIDPTTGAGEKEYAEKRQDERIKSSLLALGVVTYVGIAAYFLTDVLRSNASFPLTWWGVLAAHIIGLVLSVLAIRIEQGQRGAVIDKLCSFGKQSDCTAIINDKAAHVYGWISLAGAGLVYFAASFMALLVLSGITDRPLTILALVSILTIPVCAYSIYYQWAIAKKWCPICLGIIVVLLTLLVLLYPAIGLAVSFGEIAVVGISLLTTATWLLTYSAFARAEAASRTANTSFLKLKRDPQLFEYLLTHNVRKDLPIGPYNFLVGSPEAVGTITAFLSLTCNPCKRAFVQLDEVLATSADYNLDVVLSAKDAVLFDQFYYIYQQQGPDAFLEALRSWYASNGKIDLRATYRVPADYHNPDNPLQAHITYFMQAEIEHTPTIFVQGYKLPKNYEVEDLAYVHPSVQPSVSN